MSRLAANRDGGIAIMAALALPLIIGFAALSTEYGYGLLVRDQNQRIADLASYAAALAYGNTNSQDSMRAAAENVAKLNGIDPGSVSVSLAPSPKDPTSQSVRVEVKTTNRLFLAPVLGVGKTLDISADAFASFGAAEAACIIALDKSGTGVTLSGGVQVGAPNCYVASNHSLVAPCGTKITAKSATYYMGTLEPCQWTPNIVKADGSPAPTARAPTSDTLEDHAGVAALNARFQIMRNASWPAVASVTRGQDVEFGGASSPPTTAAALKAIGCIYDPANYNQYWTEKWDVTCPGSKVDAGSLLVHGNLQVKFNVAGSGSTAYNFSGKIQNDNGTKLEFGDGIFTVAKGVYGADLTFGAGAFYFGMGDEKCGDARYSLCSSGKITIGGPSKFVLDAGFYVGGGASLKLGLGTSNSYTIGKSSGRNAVALGGGAVAVMADANTGKGIFRLNGDLNGGGGGSCITLPASAEHDISGNVNLAGGAKLGSGTYTIDGYFSVNTGGASCSDNVAVAGKDVTIIVSGVDTPSGSDCNKKSFCLTGGNAITLNAPKAGAYADLAIIGPQSSTKKAGAVITSGGQAKISGAFYFPNGTVEFGGGGQIGDASSGCLQLIGTSISLSGGSQAISQCTQLSKAGKVAWLQ
ncbi:pilus assembly protein TadG-related protein [uncultured Agrobacterium sp.]|uniref:pilus assembly protein TadG-related protein n=1 Tax=uncultured Agrobacterium sp. TaxID=157277 RepID=UPI0025FD07AE|nr:pilus assembly protein TadG-related protein [uncultured Agrobacterium sp.]